MDWIPPGGQPDHETAEHLARNQHQPEHDKHNGDGSKRGRRALTLAGESKQAIVWIEDARHGILLT